MISCLVPVEQEHRNTCKVKQIFIEWPSYAYARSYPCSEGSSDTSVSPACSCITVRLLGNCRLIKSLPPSICNELLSYRQPQTNFSLGPSQVTCSEAKWKYCFSFFLSISLFFFFVDKHISPEEFLSTRVLTC